MKERLKEALAGRERRILPRQVNGRLFRRAAVLLPIFEKEGVPHLLFEKRTTLVRDHKGQISFPGGAFQRRDGRLMATALRESEEEVGIRLGDVEVMGELDDILVFSSRFVVSPFVGLIPHPYPFRLDPLEVEALIEVPLSLGVVSAVLLPVWVAIGAIAAVAAHFTIVVEKVEPKKKSGGLFSRMGKQLQISKVGKQLRR